MPTTIARRTALACAAVAAACVAGAASGGDMVNFRHTQEAPARSCQGALPQFAGTLRARPLALANEGDAPAFVTCGWHGVASGNARTFQYVLAAIGNAGTATAQVNCTFVHGFGGGPNTLYLSHSLTIEPGGWDEVQVSSNQMPGNLMRTAQMSCSLPPGTLVGYLVNGYEESVGSQ